MSTNDETLYKPVLFRLIRRRGWTFAPPPWYTKAMIAKITGRLEAVEAGAALLDVGAGLTYEVLVPACEAEALGGRIGREITLHTIHYVEGDPSRGAQTPRLVGFAEPSDRAFFRAFTTVKGIGIRKALRCLVRPIGQVAAAIQAKDPAFLSGLPEIGKRTAETIIAELHGKIDQFVSAAHAGAAPVEPLSAAAQEAVAVLIQLGERRDDARTLVERVQAVAPELTEAQAIIQHAYKLKALG